MRLGDLPNHPHYPMLLDELEIVLDNHRNDVIKHAERGEDRQVRIAAGKALAYASLIKTLKEAKRNNRE